MRWPTRRRPRSRYRPERLAPEASGALLSAAPRSCGRAGKRRCRHRGIGVLADCRTTVGHFWNQHWSPSNGVRLRSTRPSPGCPAHRKPELLACGQRPASKRPPGRTRSRHRAQTGSPRSPTGETLLRAFAMDVKGRAISTAAVHHGGVDISSTAGDLLEAARTKSQALAIVGAAGIGKTYRWSAIVEHAEHTGWQVLQARPAQAETRLVGSALIDLCDHIDDDALQRLPPPRRRLCQPRCCVARMGPQSRGLWRWDSRASCMTWPPWGPFSLLLTICNGSIQRRAPYSRSLGVGCRTQVWRCFSRTVWMQRRPSWLTWHARSCWGYRRSAP